MTIPAILVWRFDDVPEDLKALAQSGGDEDWVAVVPAELRGTYISWLESSDFGCCIVREKEMGDGRMMYVGCHS